MRLIILILTLFCTSTSFAQVTKIDDQRILKKVDVEIDVLALKQRIEERNDIIVSLQGENARDIALIAEAKTAGVDPSEEEAPKETLK